MKKNEPQYKGYLFEFGPNYKNLVVFVAQNHEEAINYMLQSFPGEVFKLVRVFLPGEAIFGANNNYVSIANRL